MNNEIKETIRRRFYLREGQFFSNVEGKNRNLHWYLNGECFGFGDLSPADILVISGNLEPGEVFEGFHENHMTPTMVRGNPMLIINCQEVKYPEPMPVSIEILKKVQEEYGW